jgi:hypothetical protein
MPESPTIPRDDDTDLEDDEEMGVDPIEYIGSLLQTDEGENLAEVVNKVAKHLEMQNKLLVKIVTALSQPKTS